MSGPPTSGSLESPTPRDFGARWRFVIMANGSGRRWANHRGVPKHLHKVEGEALVVRLVRQLRELGQTDVIISSSDKRLELPGVRRHVPVRNDIELDRFVEELICERVCFLYGDTYYTDPTLATIVEDDGEGIRFFATDRSIVAVKSAAEGDLRWHLGRVREQYFAGELEECRGWQLFHSYRADGNDSAMVLVTDRTTDFNTAWDARAFESASVPRSSSAGREIGRVV